MSKQFSILLTIIITAIVVSGGVYFWQQSQLESLNETINDLEPVNQEPKNEIESVGSEDTNNEDQNITALEGDYVNEKYGYSLDLPTNFKVYTEGYDNYGIEDKSTTIWVGTKSGFWTNGFYVRIISDLDSRINEVQQNASVVIGQSKVTLGGQSATKVIIGSEIGYQVVYYFVEANNHIFEIQVTNGNKNAQGVIQTIQFAK